MAITMEPRPPEEDDETNGTIHSARHHDRSHNADQHQDHFTDGTTTLITQRWGNDPHGDSPDEDDLDGNSTAPIDLAKLQSDDALLDILGGPDPGNPARDADDTLVAVLLAWRHEVDAVPVGAELDTDTALAAIIGGRHPRPLRRRHLVPLTTAAAVLLITFTGVGLAARDAAPGDMLWGLTQVLYADRAHVVEAARQARTELAYANAAFLQGDRIAAEAALRQAQQQIYQVDTEHGLSQLQATQASLAAKFDSDPTPPTPTSTPATTPSRAESPSVPPTSPPLATTTSATPTPSQPRTPSTTPHHSPTEDSQPTTSDVPQAPWNSSTSG